MNSVTPEHLVTVTQGATPLQIAILILLGVIAFGFIFMVVRWVIDLKLGTLPADIAAISKELKDLDLQISDLRGAMWSRDQVDDHIDAKIREHMEKCPHCHKH